jgi:hypothetical protein
VKKQCDLLGLARPSFTKRIKKRGGERGTGIVRLAGERDLLPVEAGDREGWNAKFSLIAKVSLSE